MNVKDMCNNDVGKGGVRVYEAHEVKLRVALVRVPFCFINLLPTSILYISTLLGGWGRQTDRQTDRGTIAAQ